MHFFSRKKALLTASLAALSGLAACGDDVTVPVQIDPVVIIITPSNAAMNIGESLIFAVQVTGGSSTNAPTLNTCTSSNAAVATATKDNSSCRVTAVSAGNATVTAAATTGQVASSAVSVSAQTPGINTLTLSPNVANLSPQQTVTITPNVTKPNAAGTVTYTYSTSSTSLATLGTVGANGSVVVTAVAPGVATITATATIPAGNGFSASTLTASTTINIGAFTAGITSLTVQPTSMNLAVGRTSGITASVVQPAGAPASTITYTSSNPAVASVSSTGVVTALTAGTTNISVRAQSAANGTFAAGDLTQIVAVSVLPLANVSIQAINQGPYKTTGLDSAYAVANQTPGPGNVPIGPALGVIAGIRRDLNPQINQPIDVTNTKDQIQVILNLQPNGQRVDSVVVYIDSGSVNSTVRRAAARQIFTNGDAGNNQTVSIETFVLTEDFTTNDVTGVGDVHYVNGLKRISASVWTTLSTGQTCSTGGTPSTNNTTPCEIQNAANIRQNVNFNNIDGFALKMLRPAMSANDLANRTWWGGPTAADSAAPFVANPRSGLGNFQAYPVIYTIGRTIMTVSGTFGRCRSFDVNGLPNFVTDTLAPFIFTYGRGAPSATGTPAAPTSSHHINCVGNSNTATTGLVGAYDAADQFRFEDYPMVVASLDNQNNPGPRVLYAYNPTTGTDPFAGPRPTLYRSSPQLINPDPIRMDYQQPVLSLSVTQPNLERWVNDAYAFWRTPIQGTSPQSYTSRYLASDFIDAQISPTGVGVGLFGSNSTSSTQSAASQAGRTTAFRIASANKACGPQTFIYVGGLLSTVANINLSAFPDFMNRESPCDFTNNAFVAQVSETDRLGNRGTFGNLESVSGSGVVTPASPLFGIDNSAPQTIVPTDMPNLYSATGDSIFQPVNGAIAATPVAVALPAGTPANATDFWFGVRYSDTRSGFNITNHGTRMVRRWRPNATPLLSNRASIDTVSSRIMNFLGGTGNPVDGNDPIYRRDSVTIYGAGAIANTSSGLALTANPQVGYYQYIVRLTDRAGNTTLPIEERAVIDQTSPLVTGTRIPSVFGASLTAKAVAQVFLPTGTDDVEALDADLFLRYQALGMVGDSSVGSTVINSGARMRFRRDRFADFHNAWAVFSDTLLSTPFGPDAFLSSAGILMPIASIRGIEPVDSTDAPISYLSGAVNPFVGFKPNFLGVYAFDVRATHISRGSPNGWPSPYSASNPFKDFGMTNLNLFGGPGEAAYTENVFPGNVSNGSRWASKDLNPATLAMDRLVSWAFAAAPSSASNLEVRAVTSTIVTQPPFPIVHLVRWESDVQHGLTGLGALATTLNDSAAGQWVYVGTLNSTAPGNPGINDQGATRFWRYSFTAGAFPQVTNGMIVQPGVTTGCYRAIGVDSIGDGITTRSFGTGCPTFGVNQGEVTAVAGTVDQTTTLRAYGNGVGSMAIALAPTLTLNKPALNGVYTISQNRPNVGTTVVITPGVGMTIDRAPEGCIVTAPANVVFPTTLAVTCQNNVLGPKTITAIFETIVAGG